MDDAREEISQRIGRRKQLDLAKKKAEELYSRISNAGSLALAAAQDTEIAGMIKDLPGFKASPSVPGIGNDAVFSAKVFTLPTDKINEPFRGEVAYYIIEVKNRSIPSDDKVKAEIPQYLSQLNTQTKGTAFYQWFQSIKEKAKIEDRRSKFYKEY